MATSVDPFLLALAASGAEGFGEGDKHMSWETPLTLIVHGVILTGRVISRKKYNDLLMGALKSAGTVGENGDVAWKAVVSALDKRLAELPDAKAPDPFLYLTDVGITNITRGGMIRKTTWCVRLSDVAAVMLGEPAD